MFFMRISQVSETSLGSRIFFSVIEKIASTSKRISKLAIPIIIIAALSSIPTAEAGPIAYAACVMPCSTLTSGIGAFACLVLCAPFFTAPCP
jgi:hypothetical protein